MEKNLNNYGFDDIIAHSTCTWCMNGMPIDIDLISFDNINCFIQININEFYNSDCYNNWSEIFNMTRDFCDEFNKYHRISYPFPSDEQELKIINDIIKSITNDTDACFEIDEDGAIYGNSY